MLDAEANALIGFDRFNADPQYDGIDGRDEVNNKSYAIAFLDSGIDLDHPFFGPDGNGDGIADRIVHQQNFIGAGTAEDNDGHGTRVASIAAGFMDGEFQGDPNFFYSGVAPDADIVALKVLDTNSPADDSTLAEALQWILDDLNNPMTNHNIVAVNMSLGFGRFGPLSEFDAFDSYSKLVALDEAGVLVVASSGNGYDTNGEDGIGYPAAADVVLGVGAVWDADVGASPNWDDPVNDPNCEDDFAVCDFTTAPDRIVSFSQREATLLEALAPGGAIAAADRNGGFVSDVNMANTTATSFAAPQVAGMAVLAKQMVDTFGDMLGVQNLRNIEDPALMNIGFKRLVSSTGVSIVDGDDEDVSVPPTSPSTAYPRMNLSGLTIAGEPTGLANRLVPPRVKDVIIGSTTDSRTYSFAAHTGSGEQLKTVPVANPDKITIHFTELVTGLTTANLSLTSMFAGASYSVSQAPTADSFTSATWEFSAPFGADQIELSLQAVGVKEYLQPNEELINPWYQSPVPANILDGDWLNPVSLSDPNGDVFPSGDKSLGGNFVFRFTVLPGDVNQDNVVGIDDLNTVRNNFGVSTTDWLMGEMTGDGVVNTSDTNLVYNNFGDDFTVWPGGGAQAASSGSGTMTLTAEARHEAFIVALAELYAADSRDRSPQHDDFWASVANDKEVWQDLMDAIQVN